MPAFIILIGTGNFQVIPGLLYSVKGFDQRNHSKFTFNYVELPVLGAYTLELFEGFRVQANAGLYLGYMLGGQVNPPNSSDPTDIDFDRDYNRMDMGYQYGLSVIYNQFKLGLQFSGGLIDISKRNNWDVKTRVTAVNVGYYLW